MDGGDGVPVALQDAADHIAAVEAAHDVDDPADLARLRAQHPLGQVAEIEPRGQRQSDEPEHHGRNQQRRERSLFNRGSIARSSHVRLHMRYSPSLRSFAASSPLRERRGGPLSAAEA